jgi:tetratricopeptide (TPR) repeat protein
MIQYKPVLLLFAAGLMLSAGSSRADDKAAASNATPTAVAKVVVVKGESPTVTAMKAANALAADGKIDEAVAAYEKMGVLKSKKMEAWRLNNEALAYLQNEKMDQADKAVPLLEKATTTDDGNYVAWNNLGTSYERTKQLDKAKDAYQKSIDSAKAANASSAKAEGNLEALQARLDKTGGAKAKDDSSDDSSDDADSKAPAADKKK